MVRPHVNLMKQGDALLLNGRREGKISKGDASGTTPPERWSNRDNQRHLNGLEGNICHRFYTQ